MKIGNNLLVIFILLISIKYNIIPKNYIENNNKKETNKEECLKNTKKIREYLRKNPETLIYGIPGSTNYQKRSESESESKQKIFEELKKYNCPSSLQKKIIEFYNKNNYNIVYNLLIVIQIHFLLYFLYDEKDSKKIKELTGEYNCICDSICLTSDFNSKILSKHLDGKINFDFELSEEEIAELKKLKHFDQFSIQLILELIKLNKITEKLLKNKKEKYIDKSNEDFIEKVKIFIKKLEILFQQENINIKSNLNKLEKILINYKNLTEQEKYLVTSRIFQTACFYESIFEDIINL